MNTESDTSFPSPTGPPVTERNYRTPGERRKDRVMAVLAVIVLAAAAVFWFCVQYVHSWQDVGPLLVIAGIVGLIFGVRAIIRHRRMA